jgi:vanadium chloroperoxidase
VLEVGTDPGWLPLGAQSTNNVDRKNVAPDFPAYPSGHATFGAAAFQSVRCFYDKGEYCPDNRVEDLKFTSEELNGMSVDNAGIPAAGYSVGCIGYSTLCFDEIDLTQNIGGAKLGIDVANNIATHGLTAAATAGPRLP